MELYGREYGFRLTVGAACEIAEKCPEGELKNFQALILGDVARATEGRAAVICALSRGWEESRSYSEPGYVPAPLTPALLNTLPLETFRALFEEAFAEMLKGLATSVTVADAKKTGTAAPTPPPDAGLVPVLREDAAHGQAGDSGYAVRGNAGPDFLLCHL